MINKLKTISDLAITHDYYCSDSSYYGLNFKTHYKTFESFYNEMGQADEDMNLVFRYDIKERSATELKEGLSKFYMEVFIVHQRKGRFVPFFIENIEESDFELINEYLSKKYLKLMNIWKPYSI